MTAPTDPARPASAPEDAGRPARTTAGRANAGDLARARFEQALLQTVEFRGETTLVVAREAVVPLLQFLREEPSLRFDRLSDLTAVDYLDLGREPRFAVVYQLMSRQTLARLRVRALVPEDDPFIDSVAPLYPSADWLEREVYDMFGIGFLGHPNLTRILMPDDWDGHPLRKDFPIGAEEVDFSFNHQPARSPLVPFSQGDERYAVSPDTLRRGGYERGDER